MHGMNNETDLNRIIRAAVCLKNFDTPGTRLVMSPLGRIPQRPADLPGEPRYGAVLIVLFEEAQRLHSLLIKRCDDLRYHPGQISFPGGRREKDEDPLACALRETREEIGIEPEALDIAGPLEPAYIIASDFHIHAFVAWHPGIPVCTPDPREVAAIVPVPLGLLCAPGARTQEVKTILGTKRTVPGFSFLEHHIWGATAILLHEIIERLKMAGWQG
jgi:8-oxo-dGTP pyrophosphatase MutT (NUDIX family)